MERIKKIKKTTSGAKNKYTFLADAISGHESGAHVCVYIICRRLHTTQWPTKLFYTVYGLR